jgi:hypothetical protein
MKAIIILVPIWFLFIPIFGQEEENKKWSSDFSVELQAENQYFLNKGAYDNQLQNFVSGAVKPKYNLESTDGKHLFKIELFFRGSLNDPNRTHADIREAYYRYNKKKWSVSIGFKKVFWGVTESNHLVDVINQADQVESFDGEEKLGQPMLQFNYPTNIGDFEFYYLPVARRRQFPSDKGRYRFPVAISRDDVPFVDNLKEWYPSFAMRWSKSLGNVDAGLSNFYGVSREPLFLGFNPPTGLDLSYPITNQSGLDLQFTKDAWQFKLESIYRTTERQDFFAAVAGFEYTFGNIQSSGVDVGIVSEYLYDSRDVLTFSGLDDDVFIGTRIAFNDVKSTELLMGGIFDRTKSTQLYKIEASRRLAESWKVALLANLLNEVSTKEILYNFRMDNLVQVRISKFF